MPAQPSNKALFILNPYAGIPPVKFIISEELKRRRDKLSYYKSLSIDESGTLIRQNFDKYDVFVAAGGDGTVHTVAASDCRNRETPGGTAYRIGKRLCKRAWIQNEYPVASEGY